MTATVSTVNRHLFDYIVDQAIWAMGQEDIYLHDITPAWLRRTVSWSFTWQEEFEKLNKAEIDVLAVDVMEEVIAALEDVEDLRYRMEWELSLR